jgi:hypothetical protein
MPSAPLAVQPATPTREAAAAPNIPDAAPTTPDHGNATARPPRRNAAAPTSGVNLRYAITSLPRAFQTSYKDPKFRRPYAIEDDYYRFRNGPRGY